MFKNMQLKTKLIVIFLLVGLVPAIVIGVLSYASSSDNIRDEVYAGMNLFAETKDQEMEDYFDEREADARVFATTRDVYQSLNILQGGEHQGETIGEVGDVNDPMWIDRIGILDDFLPTAQEEYGFQQVFVTDTE